MVERLPIVVPSEVAQRTETGYLSRRRQSRHMKSVAEYLAEHARIAREIEGVWRATTGVVLAQHEYDRAMELYKNPKDVFEADRSDRRTLKKEALTKERMADIDLMRIEMEYERLKKECEGTTPIKDTPSNTQEAEELAKDSMTKMEAELARARNNEIFNTFVKQHGGWENMSEELRQAATKAKTKVEDYIKESGY